MGTNDLFHKQKARTRRDLQRRAARREPYARVLIVCEGTKTEPRYFRGLRDRYRLSSANIEVTGDCGSDPCGIFEHAKKLFREAKGEHNPFDRVYCVFDRDSWSNYDEAVKAIESFKPANTFFAVKSAPCFEYWILLHFEDTASPYMPLPDRSAAAQALANLKRHMPDYEKSDENIFEKLFGRLEQAKARSRKILESSLNHGTDNPSTNVHELIEYLQGLKVGVKSDRLPG